MMFSTAIFLVTNLVLISGSLGQGENVPSTEEALQKASEVANIPGLNASAIPVEEAKTVFKRKCETNGGPEAYTNVENALKEVESCVRGLVNVTVLQAEIEEAKPTGDLDAVFKKYCAKSPTLNGCVENFTNTAELCLTQRERDTFRVIKNITDSLLSFVCFKEGDRIALFIAEGGPECFERKQSAIQECLNSTFGSYIPAEGLTNPSVDGIDSLPLLLLDAKECSDVKSLQTCVVRELETCNNPTPGNIADSLFNYILRATPCENLLSKIRADASVGEAIYNGSSTINGAHYILVALSFFTIVSVAKN